jgi:hypothetical protein
MRRKVVLAIAVGSVSLGCLAPSASAESTTVKGTGDIKKMYVKNGSSALVTKVFGFKGACQAHYFRIQIFWGQKAAYQADGGCYPGGQWITSLYFFSDRNAGSGGTKVKCGQFRLTYNATERSWRAFVPRSCLVKAPNRVRVKSDGDNYGSTTGGEAGPTRALGRG